jgi:4'-phosphopantetheinyl transferase EntD
LNYKNDNFTAKSIGMPEFSSSIASQLPETHVFLWKIAEPMEFFEKLPEHWPLVTPSNPIKRTESLAARYCLHDLCLRMGIANPVLKQDERDRPYLADSNWKISLTHSFPFVAAVCSLHQEVGIDIEKKGRKIEKIAPRFLNKTEFTDRSSDHVALTLAWSIKESIYKAANVPGLSFRDAIALEAHYTKTKGAAHLDSIEKTATYFWEEFDEFVLSLALID